MDANKQGALLGLAAFAIFSTHDVLVKHLGANYSAFQILFFNTLFAFPLFTVLMVHDREMSNLRPRRPWWTVLRTASVIVAAPCVFYAFSVLPLAQTYAILFSVPLIITILAIPILGEKVRLHRWSAVVVGLIGVLIVVRPGASELTLGHAAALVGAVCSAISAIVVRKIGNDERSLVLMLYPMLGTFLAIGAVVPFFYEPMPLIDLGAVVLLSLLGFIALNCVIAAYKAGEAAIVAPMQYSQIVWATVFGFFFFGEVPDLITFAGAAVIIGSGIYIIVRESRTDVSDNTPVLSARMRAPAGVRSWVDVLLRRGADKPAK